MPEQAEGNSSSSMLLDDPNIRRWHTNLTKTSPITADIYVRSLGRFCSQANTTPQQFVKMSQKKIEDVTQDFINSLESQKKEHGTQKYSPGYIVGYLKAIKSWAEWNRKPIQRKIKIANRNRTPTLENERVPTQDELRRVLYGDRTTIRTRVSIALMAFSGPRPEVQGNYLGLNGLKIQDLPEMEIQAKKKEVRFAKIPAMIVVREELSKTGHQYFTFLGKEGCDVLKLYLEERMNEGEALEPASPLIATSPKQSKKRSHFASEDRSPFLRTTKLCHEIRKSMRACGLPWRPYVFRSYFDTYSMLASDKMGIPERYVKFWMGHKGDIESVYTTHKKKLPLEMVEEMRVKYKKISETFETLKSANATRDEAREAIRKAMLEDAGFKEEEVGKLNLSGMTSEEFQQLVKQKLFGLLNRNGMKQLVVNVGEVREYITKGYEFQAALPNGEAVVRLPF